MSCIRGIEQVVVTILDAVQHLWTGRYLEVMHAKAERSYMYCLQLRFEKGIADVFVQVEIDVRYGSFCTAGLERALQRVDPFRGSQVLVCFQIPEMFPALPACDHLVGNAGHSRLGCDPMSKLVTVQAKEPSFLVPQSEAYKGGSRGRS